MGENGCVYVCVSVCWEGLVGSWRLDWFSWLVLVGWQGVVCVYVCGGANLGAQHHTYAHQIRQMKCLAPWWCVIILIIYIVVRSPASPSVSLFTPSTHAYTS